MTKRFQKLLLLISMLALGACAALVPHEYLISHERLDAKLAKSFPVRRDLANGLFSVTVNTPELGFLTAQNRISLAANFSAYSVLSGVVQGHVVLTSSLRYDASQHALFLQDAHFDSIKIEQDDAYAQMLRPALSMMLNDYLRENPLYHFQAVELRFAQTEIDIIGIEVVENGIKLKLSPSQPTH